MLPHLEEIALDTVDLTNIRQDYDEAALDQLGESLLKEQQTYSTKFQRV